MEIKAQLSESNQDITANFGVINNISDGGFERGYAQGYEEATQNKQVETNCLISGEGPQEYLESEVDNLRIYAFAYTSFKTLRLPNVRTAGERCFYYARQLEDVYLPNLINVPSYAFRPCEKLKKIDLPKATSISGNAFYKSGLETLVLRTNGVCTLENTTTVFTDTPIEEGTGFIYVPANLVEQYRQATNWSTYASQIRAIEDYPEIAGGSV